MSVPASPDADHSLRVAFDACSQSCDQVVRLVMRHPSFEADVVELWPSASSAAERQRRKIAGGWEPVSLDVFNRVYPEKP